MLDWPAFGDALWTVSDQLGIRPEWQLPVISLETAGTFDPAIVNPGGCVGINQFCPSTYSSYVNVPVDQYRQWSASQQLAGPVLAYWRNSLQYGPIRSATRLMLAQLGPGLLASAPALDSVVFRSPSREYSDNAGFDVVGKGTITVQDLANAMARSAASPAVLAAVAQAYTLRPGEQPRNAVYGDDFLGAPVQPVVRPPWVPRPAGTALAVFGVAALAMVAGYTAYWSRGKTRQPEPQPWG